ncbi:MAG: o-succinylbenzoate synthase [Chloroflexota bacterium]|nr:MAG: o-succinylbenzoate synthase [Chloroflexota bacterium]
MRSITVKSINLYPIAMTLVEKLRTSFGEEPFKACILVRLETDEGFVGWGESSAETRPGYSYETVGTSLHILSEFLVPALLGKRLSSATEVPALLAGTRGHPLAKHAVEAAVWDALAKANNISLAQAFAAHLPPGHAPRGYATVGVSIGIQPSVEATLQIIEKRLKQGYGRIKLKIKPGWDVELARGVRAVYPDIVMMLDANSAYTLADADHLKQLDEFNLLMIEQPLGYDDIYEHSKLQPQLQTPICLDESIHSANDLRLALELGACRILNLKPARVSGYTESLEIYKICIEHNLPLWIGGLLETGVGRAANVAFASLPGVTLPCDISATDRYYDPDITEPPFVLGANSTLSVPTGPGIGVEVQMERVEAAWTRWQDETPYRQ